MLGIGLSLFKGAVIILSYIKENLLAYFNVKSTSIDFLTTGSAGVDGTDDYFYVDNKIIDVNNDFTIACWIKHKSESSKLDNVVDLGLDDDNYFIFGAYQKNLHYGMETGGTRIKQKTSSGAVSVFNWHHVVAIKSSGTVKLYLNGVDAGASGSTSNCDNAINEGSSGNGRCEIGRTAGTGTYSEAEYCNLGIWSRALSITELHEMMYQNYSDLSSSMKTSLVSWYPFTTNGDDSQGNYDLSTGGSPTFKSSGYGGGSPIKPRLVDSSPDSFYSGQVRSGKYISLDSTNDYLNVADDNSLSFGDGSDDSAFSISAWIYPHSLVRFSIAEKGNPNDSKEEWWLGTTGGRNLQLYVYDQSASAYEYISVASSIMDECKKAWTHIVATYDGRGGTSAVAGMKLYINGALMTTTSGDGGTYVAMENLTGDLRIGVMNHGGSNAFAEGSISNFMLFGAELSATNVQALYSSPHTLPSGVSSSALKCWLPMQDGYGNALDVSDNDNHAVVHGGTWKSGNDAIDAGIQPSLIRNNRMHYFDGSNDYVTVMSNGTGTFNIQTFSISAWVYLHEVGVHHAIISYDQTSHATPHYAMHLRVDDSSNQVLFAWNDGSSYQSLTSSTTLSAQTWYHIVATHTSGDQKIYINGSQDASSTRSDTISFYAQEVWLGRANFGGYLDGILNDVGVWNAVLDADAVTAIYNSGKSLLLAADSGNYDNSSNLIGYWRNDTKWEDRSSNSNDGTVSGSPNERTSIEAIESGRDGDNFLLFDTTTITSGLRFNGKEYVSVYDSANVDSDMQALSDTLTFEAWIKPAEITGNDSGNYFSYYTIAELRTQTTANTHIPFNVGINNSKLCLGVTDNHLTSDERIDSSGSLTVDTWHHIAITMNGDAYAIYIDGSLDKSGTLSTATGARNVSTEVVNFVIGSRTDNAGGATGFYYGLIDEFRLYNSVLTLAQIQQNRGHSLR